MTKSAFIDLIQNDLTASCSLPFSPKREEIERIIDVESKWLFREYRDAVRGNFYVLNKKWYQTKAYKDTRTFQLPECVMGIKFVYEMSGGSRIFGIHDPDLSFDRLLASDLWLSPMSSDQITYRTIQWSFWDMSRQFNLVEIQHSFNINTHRLVILGRDLVESLYMQTLDMIPYEEFYDDITVYQWILAKCKLSLAKILGYFNYQLLGNVTINYEQIRTEAKDEITTLKESIASANAPDWFYMIH